MAVSGIDDGVQKHQKVYSFLKRNLPQDRYEGVRVIEPCVIVAEGFKKPFMFAVLGDEMLYITENPPRAPKDIKIQLDLANVTSVELIHDVAEFLGGDLKTKNQHILVIYKKFAKQSLSTHSTPVIGADSQSSSKLALLASVVSTSPVLKLETVEGNGTRSVLRPSSLVETVEGQPNASRYLKVQTNKMHLSASDSDLRNIKHRSEKAFYAGPCSLVTQQVSHRPLPPPPPGLEALVKKSKSNYRARSASVSIDRKMRSSHHKERKGTGHEYDLNSSTSSSEHEIPCYQSSLHVFHRQKSADSSYRYGATASDYDLLENRRLHHRKSSNESTGSHGEVFLDSDNDHVDENDDNLSVGKFETTELHLYVLTEDSPMFMHLRSTWNNCILKSTLKFGRKNTSLTSISSKTSNKVDNSQLLQLFYQLKTEILQSHRMEQTFVLVNELFTAAQKSFNLKKYFWKSPDLFLYMVGQLQVYMPQSSRHSSKNRGNNREDELDFVVVLLDTLVCLFRETDALPTRVNVVNANKGQAIKDLLETIMVPPLAHRSSEEANISKAAQRLLSGTDECLFTVGRETESKKLLNETLDSVTSLLYELMCVVHQANCFSTGTNILNICWLVKILESQEDTKMFVQRMMDRLTSIVSESDALLTPRDAVLLYRQLFVLKNFLEYSPIVGSQIRFGYAEEFRYYIRKPVVQNLLPIKYPLTGPTVALLDRVTNHVLSKSTQQSFR